MNLKIHTFSYEKCMLCALKLGTLICKKSKGGAMLAFPFETFQEIFVEKQVPIHLYFITD